MCVKTDKLDKLEQQAATYQIPSGGFVDSIPKNLIPEIKALRAQVPHYQPKGGFNALTI